MSFKPIKTKYWIKFLEAHGCIFKRTKGSHVHYKCPDCIRTITLRTKDKEIPPLHLKTTLETMGFDMEYLLKWISES
jgi:predicted RNA binding protein YcfA (HicA-like mRNA interferase family)